MADLLIVDDDSDISDLLTVILQAAGHQVRQAHNGLEGLDLLAQQTPDLTLLDVEMPVLSGPQMAYGLFLRDCGDEKIPVILLSGMVGLPDVAGTVGTAHFLAKPYSPEDLLRMVERALKERTPPQPILEAR
jgi:CheY-like chemotaxis protein